MQPLIALSLATGTIVLLLGLVVVGRERASRISFLFLALTTSVAVWLYSFSLMYSTTDPHSALWFAKIAFIGIAFIPTAVYHFVTALARRERRLQGVLRAMWILSAVFAFLIVTTDQIVDGVEHYWWGFYPRYGWASGPYLLFFFFGLGGALWHAIQTWRTPESETERQRMEWVSFSLCVGYLACFDYLPSFGVGVLPFGFLALVGFVMMMGHTVWRYELAEITASVAAPRILETTRGNIIVTDVRRHIRVISGATHSLLGYTDDELVGKPLGLISEDMSAIPIGEANERTPFLFENRDAVWRTRTGERIDMVVSAALISDRRGRAAGILYNGEDVSRRKKEEALRESEVRYRTLIESMREGVMLLNMDGVIQFVNQRMADLLGYVPNELVGKPVYSFINPSSRNKDGETTEMRRRVQMRTMMGRLLWVEVSEAPLTDGKGNIVGSIRVHTDVTDKHRAELALAESETRYRLLAEFSTDMISRHMPDGRLLYASPAARNVLGYEPEELIGTRPAELIHPDDAFVLEKFRLAQNTSGVAALTYRLRRKDGTYVWVESSWRPTRIPNAGDETEVVAVTRDISERKRAEQQIEYQAYHDAVTGLPNQRLLQDRFQTALARVLRERTRGTPTAMALLLIDVKPVHLGKSANGNLDWLLQSLSERFHACLRAEDSLARYRSDEFLVLLPELEDGQNAAVVAAKLLSVVDTPFTLADDETVVSANIGIAISPGDSDSFDVLVRNADVAMERARAAAPNTYQFFGVAPMENLPASDEPGRERPRF